MKIAHDSVPSENWSKNHVNSKEMKKFDQYQKIFKAQNNYSRVTFHSSEKKSSFCNLV